MLTRYCLCPTLLPRSRYVPHVGYATIVLNDYPKLKYLLLAGLGVSVVFTNE